MAATAHTATGRLNNAMDESLVSRGPSSSSSGRNSNNSTSVLVSREITDHLLGEKYPARVQHKLRPPFDQFFEGGKLMNYLMGLAGGALLIIAGFHSDTALLPEHLVGPIVALLAVGLIALFIGYLYYPFSPEFGVACAFGGTPFVGAAFLTGVTGMISVKMWAFVTVLVTAMAAAWFHLCWIVATEGLRERIEGDMND